MVTPITMPRLGLSMVEGTITEWRATPGQSVSKGDIVVVIESEKAEVEIEAFASGILSAVYVEPGTTVPIGTLLGALTEPGEAFDAAAFRASFVPELEGAPAAVAAKGGAVASAAAQRRSESAATKAAPAARALARKLGVDLAALGGSGPGGRITVEDVERAAKGALEPIAFAAAGAGPPILFVNGYGVDGSSWRRQVDALSASFNVVTYDHRGVGGSLPIGGAAITIGDLADDARALVERLGVGAAVVVGASMGAAVAVELALRHPAVVRALVLVAPAFVPDPRLESVLRAWNAFERPADEARIRSMLPWLLSRRFLAEPAKREAAASALRAMAARTPLPALRAHTAALLAWIAARPRTYPAPAMPVEIVAGDDDVLTPLEHAEAAARALAGSRLEIVRGAGHALMIERPEQLNERLRELAAR